MRRWHPTWRQRQTACPRCGSQSWVCSPCALLPLARPRRREIGDAVEISIANGITGIMHTRDLAVVCVVAFPSILKVGDILIACFSAHVIGHHLLGVVDGLRPSDEIS